MPNLIQSISQISNIMAIVKPLISKQKLHNIPKREVQKCTEMQALKVRFPVEPAEPLYYHYPFIAFCTRTRIVELSTEYHKRTIRTIKSPTFRFYAVHSRRRLHGEYLHT